MSDHLFHPINQGQIFAGYSEKWIHGKTRGRDKNNNPEKTVFLPG